MTRLKKTTLIIAFVWAAALAAAAGEPLPQATVTTDSTSVQARNNPDARRLAFAWGADIAGGIDMSGHNMSTLGIGASFGMQWKWIRFFGVGAEADIMVGNSSRTFPLSVIFRTDFHQTRQLLFLDLRGGIALNYLNEDPQEQVPYGSAGVGITLASGKTFASHLIVGYTYNGRSHCWAGDYARECPGMSYASVRLGITF